MTRLPQWKNRRLAERVLRVLERRAGASPDLGAYGFTLAPTAKAYIQTHDQLQELEQSRSAELAEGKEASDKVARQTFNWAMQIAASGLIAGFDRSRWADISTVPDDAIVDAQALIDIVAQAKAADPESIPFADAVIEDLSTLVAAARKEWKEAEAARNAVQELRRRNRENLEAFAKLMSSFRVALGSAIGRSHHDYQTLRTAKGDRGDETQTEIETQSEDQSVASEG